MDESHQNTSSPVKNNNRKRSRSRSRRKNNTNNNSNTNRNAKPKNNQKQKKKKNSSSSSFQQNNNHRKRSRSRPKKKTNAIENNSPFPEQHQQDLLEQEERLEPMRRPHSPSSNNVDDVGSKSGQHHEAEESALFYLQWDSPADLVPLHEEEAMVKMVLDRHGKSERGMLKDKPPHVVSKFRKQLSQKAPTMTMAQLCSLRRHHIKRLNCYKRMPELRLGQEVDALKSARMFEDVIETFLNNKQVEYWSEKEQGKIAASEGRPLIATPDFLLKKPLILQKTRRKSEDRHNRNGQDRNHNRIPQHDHHGGGQNNKSNPNQQHHPTTKQLKQELVVLERQSIHWIEAKMFYGASTIPRGKKGGAVGTILDKAQKYVDTFGTGAIVFMMGCGQVLADQLREIGVTVVDCTSLDDFDLRPVHHHQRTWCANDEGEILP
mmetsp:Transcript_28518/g.69392  ORF Transcript_28518/g.69392 Transcript_28518/m.69392 type:complete len:434 (-) Transcript_28518:282-1583(-)